MKFQFWTLWGTIVALATLGEKHFYVTGKSKDEVIARAWSLATSN